MLFEKQIDNTRAKVESRLITFARIRKYIDQNVSLLLYRQTIMPLIDFGCILFESSTKKKLSKLQPLQNRAIKLISDRNGYVSTEEMDILHKHYSLKKLCDRRKMFMIKMAYKCSLKGSNIDSYRPDVVLRTRGKVKLKLEFTIKQRVLKSPYYLLVKLWNQLDVEGQMAENYFKFSKMCKHLDWETLML